MIEKINIIYYLLTENVNQIKEIRESLQKEFEYNLTHNSPDFVLEAKKNQLKGIDFIILNLNNQLDLFEKIIETMQKIQPTIKAGINTQLSLFTEQYFNIEKTIEGLQDLKEPKQVRTTNKPVLDWEKIKELKEKGLLYNTPKHLLIKKPNT